jgi:very-short-patch-repair endonuclease
MDENRLRRNSRVLQEAARGMRRDGTPAEEVLWQALRNRGLGVKFRRQHPVGRFILDFWCADHRVVVELDGGIHDRQQERDAERTAVLASFGYRVIRFRNEEILDDLPGVLRRLKIFLNPFESGDSADADEPR